jgi:hypothetical protein
LFSLETFDPLLSSTTHFACIRPYFTGIRNLTMYFETAIEFTQWRSLIPSRDAPFENIMPNTPRPVTARNKTLIPDLWISERCVYEDEKHVMTSSSSHTRFILLLLYFLYPCYFNGLLLILAFYIYFYLPSSSFFSTSYLFYVTNRTPSVFSGIILFIN